MCGLSSLICRLVSLKLRVAKSKGCNSVRSSVARGGSSPPIGLWSMQNRTFLVLLRPIFCEKLKIDPPIEKQPPQTFEFPDLAEKSVPISVKSFFFFLRDHLLLGAKNLWISAKKSVPILVKTFFFWRPPNFGPRKLWISEYSDKFRLNFWTYRVKLI